MALSAAMQWAANNGLTQADVYKNINDFLATNPNAAASQAEMAKYGISPEDVAAATGGKSGGLLSGNILAGASWNSLNPTLAADLTKATGQQSSNYAVGGATTADTLNQLNTFLAGGGGFAPNSTVYLQTGGVDFLQGVDKGTIKNNINDIVSTLGKQGVNVVLTGSPYAASLQDVQTNNFDPTMDPLFNEIAAQNKNVALVGTQGQILQNKDLLTDALHTNAAGTAQYNQDVINALNQFKPQTVGNSVATAPNTYTTETVNKLAADLKAQRIASGINWEGGLDPDKAALYMADELAKSGITDLSQVGQGNGSIINKVTGQSLYSGYGERTGGNAWSGSYEGSGNTAFRTSFDAQGNPIFYTTGASSSTLQDDLLKAAILAAGVYGFGGGFEGLLSGTAGDAAAFELANAGAGAFGTTGMTAAELAAFEAANAGAGAFGAGDVIGMGTGTGITGTAPSLTGAVGFDGALGTGITQGAGALTGAAGFDGALGTGITAGQGLTGTGILTGSALGTGLLSGSTLPGLTGTGVLTGSTLGTELLGTTGTDALVGTGVLTGSTLGSELLGTGAGTAATVGGVTGLTEAGANLGTGALDTGVYNPNTGVLGGTGVGTGTGTGVGTGTGTGVGDLSGLTAGQIANLLTGVLGLAGASKLVGGGTGTGTGSTLPTFSGGGTGGYSPDYFAAVQQNYNRLLPNAPRDVSTPLQQWYSSEFNPGGQSVVNTVFGGGGSGTTASPAAATGMLAPSASGLSMSDFGGGMAAPQAQTQQQAAIAPITSTVTTPTVAEVQASNKVTQYTEPVNTLLSSIPHNTPTFTRLVDTLNANPQISTVLDQVYKAVPDLAKVSPVGESTITNLEADIKQLGAQTAIRNFISNQQNLIGFGTDTYAGQSKTMANPQYRALNALKDQYTPAAEDTTWTTQARAGAPRGSVISTPYRDPTTNKGLALQYDKETGAVQGIRFIDQSGNGKVVYNDPAKIVEAAYEYNIPLSAFSALAQQTGRDVIIPSQQGLRDGNYFPKGLENGVTLSDIASGKLAQVVASDDWLKFMAADAAGKNTNPADFAGGLNDQLEKLKNYSIIARNYVAGVK